MVDYRIVGIIKCQKVFFRYKIARKKMPELPFGSAGFRNIILFRCLLGLREEKDSPAAMIILKTRDKICNM